MQLLFVDPEHKARATDYIVNACDDVNKRASSSGARWVLTTEVGRGIPSKEHGEAGADLTEEAVYSEGDEVVDLDEEEDIDVDELHTCCIDGGPEEMTYDPYS